MCVMKKENMITKDELKESYSKLMSASYILSVKRGGVACEIKVLKNVREK